MNWFSSCTADCTGSATPKGYSTCSATVFSGLHMHCTCNGRAVQLSQNRSQYRWQPVHKTDNYVERTAKQSLIASIAGWNTSEVMESGSSAFNARRCGSIVCSSIATTLRHG